MAKREAPPAPSVEEMKSLLRRAFSLYETFLGAHPDLRPEWKYYGAKYGWSLKLFEGKRNLCYLQAGQGNFVVAFVFGSKHVEAVMASDVPDGVKQELAQARAYAEGRGVRVTVVRKSDLAVVEELLAIKRSKPTPRDAR